MNHCDCCFRSDREVEFYLIDDNWETELCAPCAKDLAAEVDSVQLLEEGG